MTRLPEPRQLAHAAGCACPVSDSGCELLATALVRLNRRAEAIAELERCATVLPRFFGNFNAGYWMKNQLRLADEYRAAGRPLDAERIEDRLRRLLVYADGDHPLVVRLKQVRGR
jgi:hypothetical protein